MSNLVMNGTDVQNGLTDEDQRKIFVGGLSSESWEAELKEYFETFGPVEQTLVKRDYATGRSRGFGFVTFSDEGTIDKVLRIDKHLLQGKEIDPKRVQLNPQNSITKVFIGGVESNFPEDQLKQAMLKYGPIKSIDWPKDEVNNQRRNFVFVEYENPDSVKKIFEEEQGKIMLGARSCDVRKYSTQVRGPQVSARGGFISGGRGRGNRQDNHMANMTMQGYGGNPAWTSFQGYNGYGDPSFQGQYGYQQVWQQQQPYGDYSYNSYATQGYDQTSQYYQQQYADPQDSSYQTTQQWNSQSKQQMSDSSGANPNNWNSSTGSSQGQTSTRQPSRQIQRVQNNRGLSNSWSSRAASSSTTNQRGGSFHPYLRQQQYSS